MSKIQKLIDGGFISHEDVQEYMADYQWQQLLESGSDFDIDDNDDFYDQVPEQPSVDYIVVSSVSNEIAYETMVFAADEIGQIIDYSDIACVHECHYEHTKEFVNSLGFENHEFVKVVANVPGHKYQTLWKKA
jgi:hypothetical protein